MGMGEVRGWRIRILDWGGTHHALDGADQHGVEDLARFVAVAYIFEGFGAVLATDVQEDFFTAAVEELG